MIPLNVKNMEEKKTPAPGINGAGLLFKSFNKCLAVAWVRGNNIVKIEDKSAGGVME
ncbi:MAG: hypothetical protein ACOX8S_03975 [Christensenellales bacterium]|jgi:hypothetical protein